MEFNTVATSNTKNKQTKTLERNTCTATKMIKCIEIVSRIIFKIYSNVTKQCFDLYKMSLLNKKNGQMEKIPPSNDCNTTLFSIKYNTICYYIRVNVIEWSRMVFRV